MNEKCRCPHHGVAKVMMFLAGISALGFWWATAFKQTLLWMDAQHFFMDVVILSLLVILSKFCGCCGMSRMHGGSNVCSHEGSCKCGDCNMCK